MPVGKSDAQLVRRTLPVLTRDAAAAASATAARAWALFKPFLPCNEAALRRAYLGLALEHHPDKRPGAERSEATELFQAIAAEYERLSHPLGQSLKRRVKSATAAAAELGHIAELRQLLSELPARAAEEDDGGVTPLMFAAKGGSIAAAQLLLDHGADLHACTPMGWSALTWAALSDQAGMVRFLVSCGSEVTEEELVLAAFAGTSLSLCTLVESFPGCVASLRTDTSSQTLLHLVCLGICSFWGDRPERYLECADFLLQQGVPVDAVDRKRGKTCLQHYVAHRRWVENRFEDSPPHMSLVDKLCAHSASPSDKDPEGNSALMLAESLGLARLRAMLLSFADGSRQSRKSSL